MTGFTNEFYKKFSRDLKIWILQDITYTEDIGQLSYLQRQGSVTLIPKGQKDKKELENWRPITLLNTLYKIIATMLANKIKKVLPIIIGKDQKGIVDGRNISDAIRGLYDTICAANNKSLTGIMLAIDFFKAFDSISFSFIKAVLNFFKFSKYLIDWIMIMLKDFTVTIMHAGNASRNINIGRG